MKNTNLISKAIKIVAVPLLLCVFFLTGCTKPNVLYGTWQDYDENKIEFTLEGTFSASVSNAAGNAVEERSGTYYLQDNLIIFYFEGGGNYNSAWEIDGGNLFITWADSEGNVLDDTLELYRIKMAE
ncbi:MAG: hypothetical protein K6G52_01205 [Treponemataceae bacterium]|nr:hypothetical protein [Treponemataceae bacterium]